MPSRCKAIKLSGERCKLKATTTGYCHIHDPQKIAEREAQRKAQEQDKKTSWAKGKQLREVIEVISRTCTAKGWHYYTSHLDKETWHYATITVERSVTREYTDEIITGIIKITCDRGVKTSINKTSFYGHGLRELHDAIHAELGRLPWLESPKDEMRRPSKTEETESTNRKTVFVVHGRDENLRRAMFDFLRSIGLNPLEWTQAIVATKKPSPYIGDILNTAFGLAQAIVVLISGDDESRLLKKFIEDTDPDYEKELTPQPRPNVLFEAGMAMGRSQERTVLVQIGKVRPWSDIAGRHITYLDNSPEKRSEFVAKLQAAGCDANTSGQDWYTTGDFGSSPDIDNTKGNGASTRRAWNSKNEKKQLIIKQVKDLHTRVSEALNNNDPTLEHDYRLEYAKLLMTAPVAWFFKKDRAVLNQLLLLKAEATTFDINRVLKRDTLGSLKWVLNSVKKMLLIIDSGN